MGVARSRDSKRSDRPCDGVTPVPAPVPLPDFPCPLCGGHLTRFLGEIAVFESAPFSYFLAVVPSMVWTCDRCEFADTDPHETATPPTCLASLRYYDPRLA